MAKNILTSGLTIWKFISAAMIVVFFFLLQNINLCPDKLFCSTQVFFTILIASFLMIITIFILQYINHPKAQKIASANLMLFFFKDWEWKNLIYVPIGILLAFLGAWVGSLFNQPLISISLAGIVMGVLLYRTKSVIIPILIHGIYNATVVWFESFPQGSVLHSFAHVTDTIVPSFGGDLATFYGAVNEIVFQLFLVAIAEEIFKVFVIVLVLVSTEGKFDTKNSIATWAALFISIGIWVIFHSIANPYSL